mgnify:CR=1 FL=1|jgi:hypothetical protein
MSQQEAMAKIEKGGRDYDQKERRDAHYYGAFHGGKHRAKLKEKRQWQKDIDEQEDRRR